ncbi:hypothetical protein ACN6MJ_10590, partial [Staphylococcus aureus]
IKRIINYRDIGIQINVLDSTRLYSGTQHREFGSTVSTDNASWRGPNTVAGGKSAYNNVQVGGAPT